MNKFLTVFYIIIANTCFAQNAASGGYLLTNANGSVTFPSTLKLSAYSNGNIIGTPTKILQIDADGNIIVGSLIAWGNIPGILSNQTDLQTAFNAKQNTITVLPFANGGISGAAATSATTGAMTVNMTSSVITITPTGNCTFNASGGVAGQRVTFSITTSGVSSFTLTWGTNFRKTGTLATGTTSARFFTVTFICIDGTIWSEISRTAVQS